MVAGVHGQLQMGPQLRAGLVVGDEAVELALLGPGLGNVELGLADCVIGKALLLEHVALHLRQAADALPPQAAMQGRKGEVWDTRPQGVETVVQRQLQIHRGRANLCARRAVHGRADHHSARLFLTARL
jgi:hypothetical protein